MFGWTLADTDDFVAKEGVSGLRKVLGQGQKYHNFDFAVLLQMLPYARTPLDKDTGKALNGLAESLMKILAPDINTAQGTKEDEAAIAATKKILDEVWGSQKRARSK